LDAAIELAARVMTCSGSPSALEVRAMSRAIAQRRGFDAQDTRRLLRVADALMGPIAAEDE
jgi:hypothetical protein